MNLKEIRTAKKMTQIELAEASGIKQATISDIETGDIKNPGIETIRKLAKALNVKIQKLIDETAA
jgi:transcriptional regulator with XRE-family HTH domain